MKNRLLLSVAALFALYPAYAQKKVLSYPFQFEKSYLAKGNYSTYFLDNSVDSSFALILKDNKKVEYVWFDKNFKSKGSIPTDIGNTVLDEKTHDYIGGTVSGSQYHFIYRMKSGFDMETVDFQNKSVSHKTILDLPSSEKMITSFSDYNMYRALAADDKGEQLVLYSVDASGILSRKAISFPITDDVPKSMRRVSQYLFGAAVFKENDEPEMSMAIREVKVFSTSGSIRIVVNYEDHPTHVFTINLSDQRLTEKVIDYGSVINTSEKGKLDIRSYVKDNMLFSLLTNKSAIRVVVNDLATGKILNKFEFTENAGGDQFAETPVHERWGRGKVYPKDLDDVKKVVKALYSGTAGIFVSRTEAGQLFVTAGTYDLIEIVGGGAPTSTTYGGTRVTGPAASGSSMPQMTSDPFANRVPGNSLHTMTSALFYTTDHFKLLLDGTTLKIAKGKVPRPIADQIKAYLDDSDKKAKATNQFAIGRNQYYGYYDKDEQEYVIEQIALTN